MIGSKVSQMILDNKQLNFYKYDSDVKELLSQVRDNINEVSSMPGTSTHTYGVDVHQQHFTSSWEAIIFSCSAMLHTCLYCRYCCTGV